MIDSHCHLFFDNLSNKIDEIIKNAISSQITAILTINTNPDHFTKHYNLIDKYKSIFISYGLHPDEVNDLNLLSSNEIDSFCNLDKVIGIGETGLDFFHSIENKTLQIKSFENHIESSYKNDLPLIIHQRNSEKEIIDILKFYIKSKPLKIVFHCFTGSKILMNFCIDNNFYMSLSGIVTFKNADDLRNIIKNIPIELLLIETDSPFLSPVPKRGKQNEPSNVKYIAEYLSNFYDIPIQEFILNTDNNFYKLFSKAIRYNGISL
ncbi:MAG: putative metal-dependent hydrolase YcfH [Alphaproteobacteria bacterium MarineAlpha5_Bin8]|nr:MAG: putative metal-dependent hydrolase YcfH [Alphaproteobacteria bacterium MarineAlpha5_Bin8]PPR44805.1 MAG: putative metal-dependent hydrolase YcfH [Alphaproteobacteria bacterium MarineAlpha5_Bin7]PPR54501.1 MAG: putative metal-dependent hydrolase YcfH [Alphaproteobacteria bacterium MarineAlpha5_Bin6]|tara:strand:- start:316 stop:1107 length:792 start_codon:yes stop_codon:yes gene_type:complete